MNKIYTSLLLLFISTAAFAQLDGTIWKVAPQASALVVGPNDGSGGVWWENSGDDVATRACFFDDTYVFNADGSFQNVLGDDTWIEPWQVANTEACGVPIAPHDGSNAATWTYDATAGITLNGLGAYLGLPKVHNNGELMSPADAVSSVTYPVTFSNNGETMTIVIDYTGGVWTFVLEKQATSSVNDLEEELFSFYPNPATSEIQVTTNKGVDELIITDLSGKQMMIQRNLSSNETIDVSGFGSGLYILECHSGNQISTEKLIIQ